MKAILVCGLLLFLVGSIYVAAEQDNKRGEKATASSEQPIERSYDRFKDETTVRLKPQKIREIANPREELSLSVEAAYKGEQPSRPKEVFLVFNSVSEQYIYHDVAETIFIVDGRRIETGNAYMTTAIPSPNLEKATLKLTMPFNTFLEIVNGKTVEMRLRKTEVTLTGSTLAAMRAFVKAVNGESKGG